jgi:hypothetical protein
VHPEREAAALRLVHRLVGEVDEPRFLLAVGRGDHAADADADRVDDAIGAEGPADGVGDRAGARLGV